MTSFIKNYWFVIVPLLLVAAYVCYASWLIGPWLGVDMVSYFKAAEYYAAFDFDKAINGYWSPLLSWMLVPAVWLGVDMTVALRVIQAVMVLVALILLAMTCMRYVGQTPASRLRKWVIFILLLATGMTLSLWASRTSTPDLLASFVFVLVLLLSHRLGRVGSIRLAIGLGVAMSLLFFAKTIGFFISGAVIFGLLVAAFNQGRLVRVGKYLAVSTVIFMALSAAWSGAIYQKYGTFSLSSASKNNFALIGPEAKDRHQIDYANTVLPLVYDDSVTPWDDPTDLSPKPWSLNDNISFYAKHVVSNIGFALSILATTSVVALLGGYYLYRSRSKDSAGLHWAFAMAALTTVILYSALLVEERYMYVILVPLLLGAPVGYVRFWQKNTTRRADIVAGVIGLVAVGTILVQTVSLWAPSQYMHSFSRIQRHATGVIPTDSRVATQSLEFIQTCYYWGVQCPALNYKLTDDSQLNDVLVRDMVANEISHYISRTPVSSSLLRPAYQRSLPARSLCISLSHGVYSCGAAHMFVYEVIGES